MTKISQYPEIATPGVEDLLIGTDVENSNATKNFTIQSVIDLAPTPNLQEVTTAGNTTTTSINANSFVKTGGTSGQYLKADGSTSTMPTLQEVTTNSNETANGIIVNKETGSGSTGIMVNTIDNIGMSIGSENSNCLNLYPYNSTGINIDATDSTGISINTNLGNAINVSTGEGVGISINNAEYAGLVINTNNGPGANIFVTGSEVDGLSITAPRTGIVVGNGINITGNVSTDTGYQLKLTLNSAAKPSTNTWTIASDERVKTNINPYTKGLETILAINPITYDYNGKAGFDPTTTGNIGIIAQDVLNIIPESINTYQAKLNEEDEEKTELYNFDSHALTFILINAIKQLSAEIEILKSNE